MRRTVTLLALLLLAGCGAAPTPAAAPTESVDVADEATVLRQVGFETGLDAPERVRPVRRYLRKNTLHGEVAVQGKDGVKTVVVQRGTVSAVTADGMTVKSSDGFSLTWSFAEKARVVQDRRPVPPTTVKSGATVGVAGVQSGDVNTARLTVIG